MKRLRYRDGKARATRAILGWILVYAAIFALGHCLGCTAAPPSPALPAAPAQRLLLESRP